MKPTPQRHPKTQRPNAKHRPDGPPTDIDRIISRQVPCTDEETMEFVKMIYEGRRGRMYISKKT